MESVNSPPPPTVYWRFDDAAPKIRNAQTHFLTSIPRTHRLPPPQRPTPSSSGTDQSAAVTIDLKEYSSNMSNVWPQKLHLYELNPCIATLPLLYQQQLSIHGENPTYVVTYRVTHHNNCFDDGETNLNLLGGSWNKVLSMRTDYLGVALLRANLTILADTVVSLGGTNGTSLKEIFPSYNDYRIINLQEQLYLSTGIRIAPLYISSEEGSKAESESLGIPDNVMEVPVVFENIFENTGTGSVVPFRVLVRDFAACAVYGSRHNKGRKMSYNGSKNLLYSVDAYNRTMMVHYPRKNPNDVRKIELDTVCGKQRITDYVDQAETMTTTPEASFHTFDELKYPLMERTSDFFMADRGSACCVRMIDPTTSKEVLVGVVHPKTVYPGKKLPSDIGPNTYLSRYFAFEPEEPYRILARSGMFCLGYPNPDTNEGILSSGNPLGEVRMQLLHFAGDALQCPRIHFVMGIVDKVGEEDSRVILSYGVSDCLSRVVEIDKSDISTMLWPSL
jgi:hypothetical protein